jgi:polyphosphate kinase 2 (PPK2 family)
MLFEGREPRHGKGGTIKRFTEHLNPRGSRRAWWRWTSRRDRDREDAMVLPAIHQHLPAAGEMVLFDRSWYNRAGVERVMGFCTPTEYLEFMRQAPEVER